MEPLHKELMPGITATLSEDGTLTLMEEQVTLDQFDEEDGLEVTTVVMPAQAARALLNFLRKDVVRTLINYRKWQKEGSSQE